MKKIKSNSIIVNPTNLIQGSTQDSIEDRSGYLRSDEVITWTGTQLEFTADIMLEFINTADGSVKTFTVALAQSPIVLNNDESAYIAIDRTTSSAATIVKSDTTAIPAHDNADKDIFVLFRRKNTVSGNNILHLPFNKQTLEENQSVRLGASGAGDGGGGLDIFHSDDFEITSASDATSGNNATYLTAGTFSGTLSDETTNPISKDRSGKYTAHATTPVINDWFDFSHDNLTLDDKQKGTDIGINIWIDASNFSTDFELVIWDVTNSQKLTSSLDVIPGGSGKTRFSTSVFIPATTNAISYGFHMTTIPVATENFIFDDIELSTNPFVFKNLLNTQSYHIQQAGSALTNRTGEQEFALGSATIVTTGSTIIAAIDDSGNTRTKFIAIGKCLVDISTSGENTIANNKCNIHKYNSSNTEILVIEGANQTSAVGFDTSVSGSLSLEKDEYFTISYDQNIANNGDLLKVTFTAFSETEHVITPAKSTASNPVSFTPTGGWTSNVTYTGSWERQGKFAVIKMNATATGVPSAGSLTFSFSSTGLVIDTADPSMLSAASSQTVMGSGVAANLGLQQYPISVMYNTTTSIIARERQASGAYVDSNGAITPSVPFTFGNTDFVEVTVRVPIVGWSSDATFLAAVPVQKVVYLKDEKATTVASGTFTSGAWRTRTLNTIEGAKEIVSLSSNQFTLGVGHYSIVGYGLAYQVDAHQIKIRDITNSTDEIFGLNAQAAAGDTTSTVSQLFGTIEVNEMTDFELQHYCQTTRATTGFGLHNQNPEIEIYAQVKITKLR